MGWTPHYQLLRKKPLTKGEIAAIAELVRKQRKLTWDSEPFRVKVATDARPDHVVAEGITKIAMDEDSQDADRLEAAVTALAKLVRGCEVRLWDDFHTFGWDPADGCVQSGSPTTPPLDVDTDELHDPLELVPAPVPAVADLAAIKLPALLSSLTNLEWSDPRRELTHAELATRDPVAVAHAAFAVVKRRRRFDRGVCNAIDAAVARMTDRSVIADDLIAAWDAIQTRAGLRDGFPYTAVRAAVVQSPAVAAMLVAAIEAAVDPGWDDASGLPTTRAEVALDVLGYGGEPGTRALIQLIRDHRGNQIPRAMQSLLARAALALCRVDDVRIVPTLLRALGTGTPRLREPLAAILERAPERGRPLVLAVAGTRTVDELMCELLPRIGDAEAIAALRAIAAGALDDDRDRAVAALTALGVDPGPLVTVPLETLAVSPDERARHDALRAFAARRDPALCVSLVAADYVHRLVYARVHGPGNLTVPFFWSQLRDCYPREVTPEHRDAERYAWATGPGREVLPPQTIWPGVARILAEGPHAVAASYPLPVVAFDAAMLSALDAEEAAALATFSS